MSPETAATAAALVAGIARCNDVVTRLSAAIDGNWLMASVKLVADTSPSAASDTFNEIDATLAQQFLAFAKSTYEAKRDELNGQLAALS